MKQLISIILLCLIFSCESEIKDKYIIHAQAKGIYNGMRAYLQVKNEYGQLVNKDTAIVIDEKFTFKGVQPSPEIHYLSIAGATKYKPLILENGRIKINIYKDSLQTSVVTGTLLNNTYQEYKQNERALQQRIEKLTLQLRNAPKNTSTYKALIASKKALKQQPITFINNNNDSYISALLIDQILTNKTTGINDVEALFNTLTPHIKSTTLAQQITKRIDKQKIIYKNQNKIQVGDIAPNFSAYTPAGKTLALNQIKGKITLIDFWASWCRPCRMENPYVVKTYHKYHKKGLEIISISLDKPHQKSDWIKAIKTDNMTWHHIANLAYGADPIAQKYGVTSIPTTFVIDSNGKVVAKNLRGRQLEYKIAELLY